MIIESNLYYDLDQVELAESCAKSRKIEGVECTFMPPIESFVTVLDPNVVLKKPGGKRSHFCSCGANVFSKVKINDEIYYRCNSCEVVYEAFPKDGA